MDKQNRSNNIQEFSLGTGGLLYYFYLKAGLLKRPLLLYKRRIFVVCMFAWLPLFIISLFNNLAFSNVDMPFACDIGVHTRFLIALPILIYSDVLINNALIFIVRQFIDCNIITSDDQTKFNSYILSAMRLTNPVLAEILIIFCVAVLGLWFSKDLYSLGVSAWYKIHTNQSVRLTPAGYWYAFISLPLFQFIILRWYYRIAVWYRFLWQVRGLKLQLNSLHPDNAGGIGFLATSMFAFLPILFAHSVIFSAMIFNHIWHENASLFEYLNEIIALLLFLIILPLLPLLFFTILLIKTKRAGTFAYAATASNYVNNFRNKWISKSSHNELLLGTPDIQSLADLSNSYQVSAKMRILLPHMGITLAILILIALPFLPLILTKVPLAKIIYRTMGFIFQ